jgi:hypothetical protein
MKNIVVLILSILFLKLNLVNNSEIEEEDNIIIINNSNIEKVIEAHKCLFINFCKFYLKRLKTFLFIFKNKLHKTKLIHGAHIVKNLNRNLNN